MTFSKGETGNSKGQVRRKPLRDALHAILAREGGDQLTDEPKNLAQKIAINLTLLALGGDLQAIKELWDRAEGKPAQSLEHTGEDGVGPIRFTLTPVPYAKQADYLREAEPLPEAADGDLP